MRVIIAGCGRVGSQLARQLDAADHEVVVIDKAASGFRRLGEGFGGRTVLGIAFDRETLEEAAVAEADAFVAVTSGDNSNVVSARVARERFGVRQVVARIYDPARARIYERYGITTIASAQWTADAVMGALFPEGEQLEASLGPGQGDVLLIGHDLPPGHPAVPAARLAQPGRCVVAAVTRTGATTVPAAGEIVQAGDRVHLAVQRDAVQAVRDSLARLAAEGDT